MKAKNISLMLGNEIIYEHADFLVNRLDKVGVVGVNGAGKTTLFKVILGEIALDGGSLETETKRIGYLPQEIIIADQNQTALSFLQSGRPLEQLQKKLDIVYQRLATSDEPELKDLLREMGELQAQLDYYEQYEAENILFSLIEQMGVSLEILNQRLSELSGGQKSKLAFLRLLYGKSDLLLLDEPTNHLDQTTREFVINYLRDYQGAVLIISHDADFLNQIVDHIMFINKVTHKIQMYRGDYNNFLKRRQEEMRVRNLLIDRQEDELAKLKAFILKAQQASRTNHALKAMGQVRELQYAKKSKGLLTRERQYKKVKMNLIPKREPARVPLEVMHLTFNYPHSPLLYKDLSFQVGQQERFLVVGENGTGKSTLLKLIVGLLQPNDGQVKMNAKTDFAYYAQELEGLDMNKTIIENVITVGYTAWQLRGILANFLFFDDDVNKRVSVLSPGEKARIALCKLLLKKANFLILDEPTNHLDPDTQAIIAENFKEFPGTIILVSHNPAFVEQIGINRMLVLPFGQVVDYDSAVLEYFHNLNN